MSWDRKADRRVQYNKRKTSKDNSKSKKFKKLKKEELQYKEDMDDINRHT